jgi:hypothetical protein
MKHYTRDWFALSKQNVNVQLFPAFRVQETGRTCDGLCGARGMQNSKATDCFVGSSAQKNGNSKEGCLQIILAYR